MPLAHTWNEAAKMKYVLVTGGVVSGLGKGVTASSIGVLLKNCGLRVTSIKIGAGAARWAAVQQHSQGMRPDRYGPLLQTLTSTSMPAPCRPSSTERFSCWMMEGR